MKKIVLILCLVFGYCFGDEALNLEIATSQDLNLTKQVSILNEAILNDNYEKIKLILDKNHSLVNMEDQNGDRPILKLLYIYTMSKLSLSNFDGIFEKYIEILTNYDLELNFVKDEIMTPLQTVILLPIGYEDKIYLLNTLIKYGADINFSDNRGLPYILISATDDEKIFDYILTKNININNYFFWNFYDLINFTKYNLNNTPNYKLDEVINSKKYKKLRAEAMHRTNKLFKIYEISDFKKKEIEIVIKFLIFVDDVEFVNLFIKNGLLKLDKSLIIELKDYARNNNKILKLL